MALLLGATAALAARVDADPKGPTLDAAIRAYASGDYAAADAQFQPLLASNAPLDLTPEQLLPPVEAATAGSEGEDAGRGLDRVRKLLLQDGGCQAALPLLTAALEAAPDLVEARQQRGDCYVRLARDEAAVSDFEAVLREWPGAGGVHEQLGHALLRLGRLDEAGRTFERRYEVDHWYPESAADLAVVRAARGDLRGATRLLQAAAGLTSNDGWLERWLAHLKADLALVGVSSAQVARLEQAAREQYRRDASSREVRARLEMPRPRIDGTDAAAVEREIADQRRIADEIERAFGPRHLLSIQARSLLAGALQSYGREAEALALRRQAVADARRAFGERDVWLPALIERLAWMEQAQGRYDEAEAHYREAIGILVRVQGATFPRTLDARASLAMLHEEQGQDAKAIDERQEVVSASLRAFGPRSPRTMEARRKLAATCRRAGDYARAIDEYAAVAAVERDGPPALRVTTLDEMVTLYRAIGSGTEALRLAQQVAAIALQDAAQDADPEAGRAARLSAARRTLVPVAKLHLDARRYALAEVFLRLAEPVAGTPVTDSDRDELRRVRAQLFAATGRIDAARTLASQALAEAQAKTGAASFETIEAIRDLARLDATAGRWDGALPLYRRSLSLMQERYGPDHPWTVSARDELAIAMVRGLPPSAANGEAVAELLEANLASPALMARPDDRWSAQLLMAVARARSGRLAEAAFYAKQAVNTVQGLRGTLAPAGDTLQSAYVNGRGYVYRVAADILIRAGRLGEAQQVLRMLKQQEYDTFVQRSAAADESVTRADPTADERRWQAQYDAANVALVAAGEELATLRQKPPPARSAAEQARIDALVVRLESARRDFQAVLRRMQEDFARLDRERYAAQQARALDVSMTGMVRDLGRDVVLLQYVVLDDGLRILLTTGEVQKAYRVDVPAGEVNRAVFELQRVLRSPALDPRPAARRLYGYLVEPLRADLEAAGARTLMASLDGSLRYIPLAALYDGQHYLAERYATAVYIEAGRERIKDAPQPAWAVAGLGVSEAHPGFPALSEVPAELDGIVRRPGHADGVLDGVVYLDSAFTEATLRRVLADRYPVLHVASHFEFRPGTDTESFLLLGDGSRLSLAQMRELDFSGVDLLTLSACETAVGGSGGSEVEGLAVTAQKQGAKGVLASLWPVADSSTRVLMQQLYRERQAGQLSKAEALRQAQLALLRGDVAVAAAAGPQRGARRVGSGPGGPKFTIDPHAPYAHPYFWAPFVLMGNWR